MDTYIRNFNQNADLYREAAKNENDFSILDTETTGLEKDARMVEFAALKVKWNYDKQQYDIVDRLHLYINPEIIMSDEVVSVHHITNEFLKDKPTAMEVFQQIDDFLGSNPVIGAYNSKFDLRILDNFYRQCGRTLNITLEIDFLKIAKDMLCCQKLQNHKLATVCNYYGVDTIAEETYETDEQSKELRNSKYHSAMFDTYSLYLLANAMLKEMLEQKDYNRNKPLQVATVKDINFWQGYRGNSRLYVITNKGVLYYDMRKDMWQPKLESTDLSTLNMDDIESQVFESAWKQPQWSLGKENNYQELCRICRNGAFA